MNKIGILTYQGTINYGAMLQAYALCRYINSIGIPCEVINYHNSKIENEEYKYTFINFTSIKSFITSLMYSRKYKQRKDKFMNFYNKYVKNSLDEYNMDNISRVEDIYSKIIVGSDQVWNMNLNGSDYTYMLDFMKNNEKKYSYAASFGYSTIPENYVNDSAKYLNEFKYLCVREKSGEKIVRDLLNKEAITTIDPTFLLNGNEWKNLVTKNNGEKYIFVYMINYKKYIKSVIDFAKKNNAKIIAITESVLINKDVKIIRNAGPEDFLSLIANSFCVITGSFHAVSLSINMKKDFYYLNNKDGKSSRVNNILSLSDLNDREIDNLDINFESINYNEKTDNLEKTIENSKKILKKIVEK